MSTALSKAGNYFDRQMIDPLRQTLIGRKLIAENPAVKGDGITSVDINRLTDMGKATISYKLPGENRNRDNIKVARETVDIPVLHRAFEVPRQEYNAYLRDGIQMDASASISAAQAVGVEEDALILKGWDLDGNGTYEIEGMFNVTGANTISASLPFSTSGNASTAVASALAAIEEDKALAGSYNLILNPTQWGELLKSRSANGFRELPEVIELLNLGNPNGPGRVYSSGALADTEGIVAPVDPARVHMQLYIPLDMRNELGVDSRNPETSPIYGTVYELVYPQFKHPEAICTLSNI